MGDALPRAKYVSAQYLASKTGMTDRDKLAITGRICMKTCRSRKCRHAGQCQYPGMAIHHHAKEVEAAILKASQP